MLNLLIPLVNWGMGTALIIVFAVVCVALVAVVLGLAYTDKSKGENNKNRSKE